MIGKLVGYQASYYLIPWFAWLSDKTMLCRFRNRKEIFHILKIPTASTPIDIPYRIPITRSLMLVIWFKIIASTRNIIPIDTYFFYLASYIFSPTNSKLLLYQVAYTAARLSIINFLLFRNNSSLKIILYYWDIPLSHKQTQFLNHNVYFNIFYHLKSIPHRLFLATKDYDN